MPLKVVSVAIVGVRCVEAALWGRAVVVARVMVGFYDFGEVALTFGANNAMLVPIPLVLALVAEDELALLRLLCGHVAWLW